MIQKIVLRRKGKIVAEVVAVKTPSFRGFTATLFGAFAGSVFSDADLRKVAKWAETETAPQFVLDC